MSALEIPSDDDVVTVLQSIGGRATAIALRDNLIKTGHGKSRCELAIQRAADRGRIFIWRDWTLNLDREQKVA